MDEGNLHRLMWWARTVQALRISWVFVTIPVPVLAVAVSSWILYAGAAYTAFILFLGRGVVPHLGRRIREVAVALHTSGRITTARYNEAAVLVNYMLTQGPPQPGDRMPMPLRPSP